MSFNSPHTSVNRILSSQFDTIERQYNAHLTKIQGTYSESGIHLVRGPSRSRGGYQITPSYQQSVALNKCCEILGNEIWSYGYKSGRRNNNFPKLLKEVSDCLKCDIHPKKLRRWLQHFVKYGETPEASRKRLGRKALKKHKSRLFSRHDDKVLKRILYELPQLYLDEFALELKRRTRKKFSHTSVWRRMHDLGYSLQVANYLARQASIDEQNRFYIRLKQHVRNILQVLIIDESSKGKKASRRRRGWSLVGISPIIYAWFMERHMPDYTFVGAANILGFVKEACDVVKRDNSEDRGTMCTEKFEKYIREKVVPILGRYRYGEPNSIVIMDNVIIHLSDKVEKMINAAGAILLLTAPYSPQLNPIEYFFATYKATTKRLSYEKKYDWVTIHWLSMKSVTEEGARNTFKNCRFPCTDEYCSLFLEDDDITIFIIVLSLIAHLYLII